MSAQQIVLAALAAVLVFWMLGAYNRLVALRNGIGAALGQLDEPLQRRAATVAPLATGLRTQLPEENGTLDAVLAALAQVQAAADALRARPAQASRAAALAGAEAALAASLARLLALIDHHPQLRDGDALVQQLATLRDAAKRLAFTRQLFNDAVNAYNEALRQFPTRLVSRLFGFAEAGVL
jgi:LemA protein